MLPSQSLRRFCPAGNVDVKLGLGVLSADILSAVRDIAARVRQAGGRALMVGGSVRDLLLGATDV